MARKRLSLAALMAMLSIWMAHPVCAGQPGDWSYKVAHNVSLSTFPTIYVMDFGTAETGAYRINYTYGGTGTVTVVFQGSVDNANWVTIATPISASSASADLQRIALSVDGAGTAATQLLFPYYRLNFTASGGSPSLTALNIFLFRRGGTVER